jgi:Fic family protein
LNTPAIYLSEYIIKNKVEYYRCLRDVTEKNEWEDYILYMLDMIEETANKGLKTLNKITTTMEKTATEIKNKLPKSSMTQEESLSGEPSKLPMRYWLEVLCLKSNQ